MAEQVSRFIIFIKNTFSIGALLSFLPLAIAAYFLRDHINIGGLLVKLTFVLAALIVVYLVFKIILKLIHRDEQERELDNMQLVDITLFNGITNRQILFGAGVVVGVLLFSLIPAPWNLFLILGAFYGMFTMLTKLA